MLTPALTITGTARRRHRRPRRHRHYTVTVTDTGQTPYAGITVTDDLAGLLDDAAYNNDATASTGTVSYASPALTWTGSLAPGATATITYSATVNNPDTGDKILTTSLTSTAAGSNCTSGSTDPACTTTVAVSSDDRELGQRHHRHTRQHGQLHRHRHQQRPGAGRRRRLHRAAVRRPGRRQLQQRRQRQRRPPLAHQPGPDLDR